MLFENTLMINVGEETQQTRVAASLLILMQILDKYVLALGINSRFVALISFK